MKTSRGKYLMMMFVGCLPPAPRMVSGSSSHRQISTSRLPLCNFNGGESFRIITPILPNHRKSASFDSQCWDSSHSSCTWRFTQNSRPSGSLGKLLLDGHLQSGRGLRLPVKGSVDRGLRCRKVEPVVQILPQWVQPGVQVHDWGWVRDRVHYGGGRR